MILHKALAGHASLEQRRFLAETNCPKAIVVLNGFGNERTPSLCVCGEDFLCFGNRILEQWRKLADE